MSELTKKKERNKNELFVCCPVCGKRIRKTALTCDIIRCDQCGTQSRAFVVRGVVTVLPYNEEENEFESVARIKAYFDQLLILATG